MVTGPQPPVKVGTGTVTLPLLLPNVIVVLMSVQVSTRGSSLTVTSAVQAAVRPLSSVTVKVNVVVVPAFRTVPGAGNCDTLKPPQLSLAITRSVRSGARVAHEPWGRSSI